MRKNLLRIYLITLLILSVLSGLNVYTIEVNAQDVHDIAVISVVPSATSVRLGELVNITVVVENQGTDNETFDITVYHDTSAIETKTDITLIAGTSTSLAFAWNTADARTEIYATDIKEKNYTINATASTVPEETDTEDNTLVSTSKVKIMSQYIAVIPQCTLDETLTPGKNITVSIYTDYNGSDVWGYQFTLSYNFFVLHGVKFTNGDLIVGGTAEFVLEDFDNEAGELDLTGAFFFFTSPDPAPLTSGPGILANITFTVVGEGDSQITLGDETALIGYTDNGYGDQYDIVSYLVPAPGARAHLLHGFFQNKPVTHDIAVISVVPSATSVRLGELVNITVVVKNQGTMAETFDVTIAQSIDQINWWRIGTKTIPILAAGTSISLTFTWNTTIAGTHTIRAVASTVSGEEDTEDNTLESDDTVAVTRPQSSLGLPVELIIIAIVVVVIGAVSAYAVKRMRTRKGV